MLKAMQDLRIGWTQEHSSHQRGNLSGERVAWHLPQLLAVYLFDLQNGELVLSCPKLYDAWFQGFKFMHVKLEDGALGGLVLNSCRGIQFAVSSSEDQFRRLIGLTVLKCIESGRHVIEDIGQMGCLECLIYRNFPAARMPSSFPRSLQKTDLYPLDWRCELPGGLKDLPKLEVFVFDTNCRSWDVKRPWEEILPIHSLQYVKLGSSKYLRWEHEGRVYFQQSWWEDPPDLEWV